MTDPKPSPELVARLWRDVGDTATPTGDIFTAAERHSHVVTQAYAAGASDQLDACLEAIKKAWEIDHVKTVDDLLREVRAICRPRPLSDADAALLLLDDAVGQLDAVHENAIRRALERLKQLEEQANG